MAPEPVTNAPRIETTPGGPYLVHSSPVRKASMVMSEHGEPMTWRFGDAVQPTDQPIALCRCGHSQDKPYCDGSHAEAAWDSADAAQPDEPFEARARRKEGTGYTLLDDTALCVHAGLCGTAKTSVWKLVKQTDDTEVRGTVIRMVEKCPSGRLANVVDGEVVEPSLGTEVCAVTDGPLWVTGGIPVTGEAGEQLEVRNRVTLCRCGASKNKPLCDGTHADIGFEAS